MKKFVTFKVEDEDKINKFLEESGEDVVEKVNFGTIGRICFFLEPYDEEKERTRLIVASLKKGLIEMELKRLGQETQVRFWQGQNIKNGEKSNITPLMRARAEKEETEAQIYYTKQVMKEIETVGKIAGDK